MNTEFPTLQRRGFLAGMLAIGAAPAILRLPIMKIKPLSIIGEPAGVNLQSYPPGELVQRIEFLHPITVVAGDYVDFRAMGMHGAPGFVPSYRAGMAIGFVTRSNGEKELIYAR